VNVTLSHMQKQLAHLRRHSTFSFWAYRYRYLATFTLIGLASILLEIYIAQVLLPPNWYWGVKAVVAFVAGLSVSCLLNTTINFQVPRAHLSSTFRRFALVSTVSFALNMLAILTFHGYLTRAYGEARLVSSGLLFLLAYTLHRRYTFDLARNFGVAVYASEGEQVPRIYAKIGRNCDHVHVDLIDQTMSHDAAPVDLGKLTEARKLWQDIPVCLHIMSRSPRPWVEQTWDEVDWYLFHADAGDLTALIAECRLRGKKVGIVWHCSVAFHDVLPHLPHVDFAMALGIPEPGRSGQKLVEEALNVTDTLDRLRERYGYEVMFDGGVNLTTISRIRAKYIVAASAVLHAADPVRTVHTLRTGARYERRVA
jgi:pentose-5-phosphate-3-epimerase/putative flippase GtrA